MALPGIINALGVGGVVAAVCFFLARLFADNGWLFLAGGLLLIMIPVGWFLLDVGSRRSAGKLWSEADAAAMIDDHLHLESQLSAAYEGLA
ncbi:MAG: hypothetical protein SNJ52_02520, partial [Verrucomicrobiia bacterium]